MADPKTSAEATIRLRERYNRSPREGERPSWDEWQVVKGGRVMSRHDTLSQAKAAKEKTDRAAS